VSFGESSAQFDQGLDAPGTYRNKEGLRVDSDPYAGIHKSQDGKLDDAPRGDVQSEAQLRYEDHAYLRMQAKREQMYGNADAVTEEDQPATASDDYTQWRAKKIKTYLAENLDTHATDHSTIMTNSMHAEKALAYDVAIGMCDIREEDMHQLRIAADWRFVDGLHKGDPSKVFAEYFQFGKFKDLTAFEWADAECRRPGTIADEREWAPASKREGA